MSRHPKNIALFGGSFNPPHEGHREIVRRVARRNGIDEVWVLPVWRHPFRKKLPAFGRRVGWCRKFFRGKKIKIKTYEHRPHATGRTVDLLRWLTKRFPSHRFWWVMGSDSYRQRRKWKDFATVRKLARLIVFPRGPQSPIPNLSSTRVRRQTRTGAIPGS